MVVQTDIIDYQLLTPYGGGNFSFSKNGTIWDRKNLKIWKKYHIFAKNY